MKNRSSLVEWKTDSTGCLQMAEGPWEKQQGLVTLTDAFFTVSHYDLPPRVDVGNYSIVLSDTKGRERSLLLSDIQRLPTSSVTAVLECAGNSRGFLPDSVPGTPFGHGCVGNAIWTGTSLRNVFEYCGLDEDFEVLVVRARDSGMVQPENMTSDFAKGLPLTKCLHADTLLAWEMNGSPLTHEHGAPLRLIVPGWFGVWWVKWVARIECVQDFSGFWQSMRYTYQGDDFPAPQVVDHLIPKSIIVQPVDGTRVSGERLAVRGYAWAGEDEIERVDVSLDGGKLWLRAILEEHNHRWAWVPWEYTSEKRIDPGPLRVSAGAMDGAGHKQPWKATPNRLGYSNNSIHVVNIESR